MKGKYNLFHIYSDKVENPPAYFYTEEQLYKLKSTLQLCQYRMKTKLKLSYCGQPDKMLRLCYKICIAVITRTKAWLKCPLSPKIQFCLQKL